jgi:hypothetical protein
MKSELKNFINCLWFSSVRSDKFWSSTFTISQSHQGTINIISDYITYAVNMASITRSSEKTA